MNIDPLSATEERALLDLALGSIARAFDREPPTRYRALEITDRRPRSLSQAASSAVDALSADS